MGARTDQAREQVIAAREGLAAEAEEARRSAIEAVNLPAKARDDPARFGALAVATAFVGLRGPQRLLARMRRIIFGAPKPKTLLPHEIEKAVEGMGRDPEVVRRQLEREFAGYLEEHRKERSLVSGPLLGLVGTFVNAFSQRAGRELVARLLGPRASRDRGRGAGSARGTQGRGAGPGRGSRRG